MDQVQVGSDVPTIHPELRLIHDGQITSIKVGSLSYKILEYLFEHKEGLTYQELKNLTGTEDGALKACLWRLLQKNDDLRVFNFYVEVDSSNARRYVYRIKQLESDGDENSLKEPTGRNITEQMRSKTARELESFLGYKRGLETISTSARRIQGYPGKSGLDLVENSTWAFHTETGAHQAIRTIVMAASAGKWTTAQSIRRALSDIALPRDFFHRLEGVSFYHAPELGFVVRCLTELPDKGNIAAFFLDPAYREELCTHAHTKRIHNGRESTCFDRVSPFDPDKLKKRIKNVKARQPQNDSDIVFNALDEKMILEVAKGQAEGNFRSTEDLAAHIGRSRTVVSALINKALAARKDWRFSVRVRSGQGVEAILYEGSQKN